MVSSPEVCVGVIEQAFRDTERLQGLRWPVPRSTLGRRLTQLKSLVDGRIPGEMGMVGDQRHIVEEAVRNASAADVSRIGKSLDDLFKGEAAAITHTGGIPEGISPETMQRALLTQKAKIVVQHPELFQNISPALRQVLEESQRLQGGKLGIAQALGYPIEAIDGPYLRQMWDLPEAELVGPVAQTRGRVSIAKERVFGDILEGMEQGLTPTEHTVGELVEGASALMDEAIADAFERQIVLRRWGTKGAVPAKGGATGFNHPLYKGWSGPQDIVNAVDQMHAPVGRGTRQTLGVVAALKNTVFGIADIGVFGVQVLRDLGLGGIQTLAGTINRGLALGGLPHMSLADNLAHALQANVRGGVHIGIGPSAIKLRGGTILKYIPIAGKHVDAPITRAIDELTRIQFGQILTAVRLMRYEGDLMMLHLLGRNIDDTAVLRTAGDWANAGTGASRGAQRTGRRSLETATLTSFQMGRSELASWTQLANAVFNPKATATERLLGMMTLASLGATIYGLGSAVNMAFGNGPVEWDPRSSKWATINIKGNNIPIIPQRGLIRAIGKSITALEKEDPARLQKIWAQFALSKVSPAGQEVLAAIGVGYEPGRGFTANLSAMGRLLNILPLPPIAEQAVSQPNQRDVYSLTEAFVGLNPFPESEFDQLQQAREQAISDLSLSGKYDDLNQRDKAVVDRQPGVVEAQRKLDEQEPRTQEGKGFRAASGVTERSVAEQEQDNQNLDAFFTEGGPFDPQRWSDVNSRRLHDRFVARDAIFTAFGIRFEEGTRPAEPIDRAIFDYFSVDVERFRDADGEINWGGFFDAQDAALSGLSAADRESVIDEVIKKNETSLERSFRKLRDELDEYYDIPSEDQQARQSWRRRHPRQDAILYITGSTTKLMGGVAQREALGIVRRLFGENAKLPQGIVRKRSTGGGLLPRRSDILPTGSGGILPRRSDILP